MTETKPLEPSTSPEPDVAKLRPSGAAVDPGQTKLLPPMAALNNQELENNPTNDSVNVSGLTAATALPKAPIGWFKKLSQPAIIWISMSIILIFFTIIFLLIVQSRQKKIYKPLADEQLNETDEIGSRNPITVLKKKSVRRTNMPNLLLADDEFVGQAPFAVKASGPVISADIDPQLAALVDALKIRLKIVADSKSIGRGNTVTRVTKGDFRGFKINIQEKIENQNKFSEEITVITPQKGFVKTVNHMLESVRESDLTRFALELQKAGLEIVKLPLQPENKSIQFQLKTVRIFGNPVAGDYLIAGKNVAKISLGMPTAQLETMLLSSYIVLKRKVLVNDIYYDVYKILDQSNEPLFFVYGNKGRVWGISIISAVFKTALGIGINSSLGEMRINYPRVSLEISEKKTPFVRIDSVDGLFVIQSEGIDIQKQIFPSKTKIISILIGNAPEFE